MRYLAIVVVSLLMFAPSPAMAQNCGSCGGCPGASQSTGGTQSAPKFASMKLLDLNGDTVDLVAEMAVGPRVLFTFRSDSGGREAAATVQKAWAAYKDSGVTVVGVFCGPKQQADAVKKQLKLGFPLLLDQGCAGSAVLGFERCPGALFVNRAGKPIGRSYLFMNEVMNAGMQAVAMRLEEVDPVCGMRVDPKTAAASYDYQGRTYHFCNQVCKDKFVKEPQKYLSE